jgi:phospholipase C
LIKENRSFDHYFGTFPGADGATSGKDSLGKAIPLGQAPDETPYDLGHSWRDALIAIDGGGMGKFDQIENGNVAGYKLPYTQFHESNIPNYFAYARNFVLADRMFSSMAGPSFPNHLYTVAAEAGGVIENPHPGIAAWACDSDKNQTVLVKHRAEKAGDHEGDRVIAEPPCFDFKTLADSLEAAHISWKYYAPGQGQYGYQFSTLDAIRHIRKSALWTEKVVPDSQFCFRRPERTATGCALAGDGRHERASATQYVRRRKLDGAADELCDAGAGLEFDRGFRDLGRFWRILRPRASAFAGGA